MCKASSLLQDETSVNGYLELVRTWMKDTTSLIATSVKSGRVVGAVVARINSDPEKTDTYHRVQVRSRFAPRKEHALAIAFQRSFDGAKTSRTNPLT